MKPKLTKKVLSQWIAGIYGESIGLTLETTFDIEKARKADTFSKDVMRFLTEHNLLNEEMD